MTCVEAHIGYVGPFPTKPGMNWQKPYASWTSVPYPIGVDKHHVGTSPMIKLDNDFGEVEIGYMSFRGGDVLGEYVGILCCCCALSVGLSVIA